MGDRQKSINSVLMHTFYAVADRGKGPEILKLYVEEMNDPNSSDTAKRAYQLQNIEKVLVAGGEVQDGKAPSPLAPATSTIKTVADLYEAVKYHDEAFNPSASSKTVTRDGKPRILYQFPYGKGRRRLYLLRSDIDLLTGFALLPSHSHKQRYEETISRKF